VWGEGGKYGGAERICPWTLVLIQASPNMSPIDPETKLRTKNKIKWRKYAVMKTENKTLELG